MRPTRSLLLNLSVFQRAGAQAAGIPQSDPVALSKGIAIVRKVLQENPNRNGWKTSEIYNLALKEKPEGDFRSAVRVKRTVTAPPHPEHPVRSKSFLKEILSQMQGYKDIKLVRHVKERAGSSSSQAVFVWKAVDKSKLWKPPVREARKPSVGVPLGVHEDFGHLNKRRQRARKESIIRGILQIKAKKAALAQAAATTETAAAPVS